MRNSFKDVFSNVEVHNDGPGGKFNCFSKISLVNILLLTILQALSNIHDIPTKCPFEVCNLGFITSQAIIFSNLLSVRAQLEKSKDFICENFTVDFLLRQLLYTSRPKKSKYTIALLSNSHE